MAGNGTIVTPGTKVRIDDPLAAQRKREEQVVASRRRHEAFDVLADAMLSDYAALRLQAERLGQAWHARAPSRYQVWRPDQLPPVLTTQADISRTLVDHLPGDALPAAHLLMQRRAETMSRLIGIFGQLPRPALDTITGSGWVADVYVCPPEQIWQAHVTGNILEWLSGSDKAVQRQAEALTSIMCRPGTRVTFGTTPSGERYLDIGHGQAPAA